MVRTAISGFFPATMLPTPPFQALAGLAVDFPSWARAALGGIDG
jgi:hypothetical protein